ncbi:MAG: DUF5011 domain-containing protein [Bacteroidetes bacterium]|nr:DUF5011 domain-containing protein [Bacteroidota bacterium]
MRIKSTLKKWGSTRLMRYALGLAIAAGFSAVPPSLQAQSSTATPWCGATHPYTQSSFGGVPCNCYLANIERVQVGNLDHKASCPDSRGVYTYWNNVDALKITPGSDYTVKLTSGITRTYYSNEWGIYIDYNGDHDFDDPTEFVGRGISNGAKGTVTINFTVPCTAISGKTRIRIRQDYTYSGSSYRYGPGNGCGVSVYGYQGYGESWDFDAEIASVSAPSANFSIPDTVYTNSPANFINSHQFGYIANEWDAVNLGNSPDATSTNFKFSFPNTGTYQVRLSSTNCQGTAITTKSVDVVDPTSSPQPVFVVSQNEVIYDGVTPVYIDYYDLSLYGPTQWEWIMTPDMLNGAPYIWTSGSQYDQNPSAFFYDFEIYDVCLAVGNSAGYDTLCKSGYINIKQPGAGGTIVNILGQQLGSTVDSGWVYDSGGPTNSYKSNEFYDFVISPCGASKVTLNFTSFNLNGTDELSVYDGSSSTGPLIGSFKGTNLPPSVTSTGGSLYLVFLSQNGSTGPGFAAYWTSIVPNNGAPAADFFVPDTVYQCSLGNSVRFENTSTGILPDQASYDWIFDYDSNLSYPTGYADTKDEMNPEWSYMNAGSYSVRMVLKSCEGNDTAVKTFIIGTTSNNPIVDFKASEHIVRVGDVVTLTDMSVAACDYEWTITPNTYTIENGGSVNDPIMSVKFTAPGSYNVKLDVGNDNGTTTHIKTNYIDVIDYCHPAIFYPTVADVGINKVKVGDMTKSSGSGMVPGYTDYSGVINIDLTLGKTYSFEISRNTNVNAINRKIWIDYNRDGDFDDAGELVASETASNSTSFSGSFTVPGVKDLVLGLSKMRIGASLVNTPLTACGPAQVGEYEDYDVHFVLDDVIPVITLIGGDEIIEMNQTYTDKGATAFDNIEGDITAAIVVDNGVDMSQPGVYFVTYNVKDKSGNMAAIVVRKVTVVADLTKPTITLNGNNPLLWSVLIPYNEPGFNTMDMPSGKSVDSLVTVSGMVDELTIGDYDLVYTVSDAYGNKAEMTRKVQVRDTTAPEIISDSVVKVQVGKPFIDPVYARDNFDKTVAVVKVSGIVLPMTPGTYTQTYTAQDMSGNMAMDRTITFEVGDFVPPVIHYTPGTEVVKVQVFDFDWRKNANMDVFATDDYYGYADLQEILPANFSVDVLGEYTITYKATDKNGNVATFNRIIRVVDEVSPTIVVNPVNLPRWSTYDFNQGVTVQDNYYSVADFANSTNGCRLVMIRSTVDFNYPGIYEVCYQAIDGSGNKSGITCRLVKVGEESAATGLDNVDMDKLVQVYPNPSQGNFIVKVDAALNTNTNVTVINAQGQTVQFIENAQFVSGELQVNLQGAAPGVYIVRVKNGDQIVNKKLTIQ